MDYAIKLRLFCWLLMLRMMKPMEFEFRVEIVIGPKVSLIGLSFFWIRFVLLLQKCPKRKYGGLFFQVGPFVIFPRLRRYQPTQVIIDDPELIDYGEFEPLTNDQSSLYLELPTPEL